MTKILAADEMTGLTVASKANMIALQEVPGMFAWSSFTHERYSATPGDYFFLADADVLEDSEGFPMVLVTERTDYIDANA